MNKKFGIKKKKQLMKQKIKQTGKIPHLFYYPNHLNKKEIEKIINDETK